jgi:cell division septum initiation protein DivIVA
MGDISEAERLMEAYKVTAKAARDAEAVVLAAKQEAARAAHDAKKGTVWKPFVAMLLTFVGTLGGSAFAAGRYFESAKAKVDKIDELVTDAQKLRDQIRDDAQHQKDQIKEAYNLALDAKGIAVLQCHRLDGKWNERICP